VDEWQKIQLEEEWRSRTLDQVHEHGRKLAVIETKQTTYEQTHKEIIQALEEIKGEMTRYKGFMGGVAFLASGIAIAWNIGKDWIIQHFK